MNDHNYEGWADTQGEIDLSPRPGDEFLASPPAQANHNPLLDLSADKVKIWLERVQKLLEEENVYRCHERRTQVRATKRIDKALFLADRREWLGKEQPTCECGSRQIQLIDWTVHPAEWRCRECGLKFKHEPELKAEDLD